MNPNLYIYADQRETLGTITADHAANGSTVMGAVAPKGLDVGNAAFANSVQKLSGTTAGALMYSQPFTGSGYKKVIIYADGYENTSATAQVITFPSPFSFMPYTIENGTGMTVTITVDSITFPEGMTAVATDGYIILEGL